jgi:hypothetical protein
MGLADSLTTAYKVFKDGKSAFETGKNAGAVVRAYVDNDRRQQNVVLSQVEAWKVFRIFFASHMDGIKPSSLKVEHCKLAEKTLLDAWSAYEQMNFVEGLFKKFASPAASVGPLGVANLLMKLCVVYLDQGKQPSQAEIDDFDRNGGVVKQQIAYNWQLYLADLITDNGYDPGSIALLAILAARSDLP